MTLRKRTRRQPASAAPVHVNNKEPITTQVDSVDQCWFDIDRRWFAEHPRVSRYYRPFIDGEFMPHRCEAREGFCLWVMVTQILPKVRHSFELPIGKVPPGPIGWLQ